MVGEVVVICMFLYCLLADFVQARTELLRQQTRQLEIENNRLEYND